MKKPLTLTAIILISIFALTGCSDTEDNTVTTKNNNGASLNVTDFTATLENGTEVDCVYVEKDSFDVRARTGGPSCDWENARKK